MQNFPHAGNPIRKFNVFYFIENHCFLTRSKQLAGYLSKQTRLTYPF